MGCYGVGGVGGKRAGVEQVRFARRSVGVGLWASRRQVKSMTFTRGAEG